MLQLCFGTLYKGLKISYWQVGRCLFSLKTDYMYLVTSVFCENKFLVILFDYKL